MCQTDFYQEAVRVYNLYAGNLERLPGVTGTAVGWGHPDLAQNLKDRRAAGPHIAAMLLDDDVQGIPEEFDGVPVVRIVTGQGIAH
jgi:hypothetical protein